MKTRPRPHRILLSLSAPDGTTRFVDQVSFEPPADVQVRYFGWLTAIFGRYDLFHVHWPEYLIRAGHPARQWLNSVLTTLFIIRLAVCRTPVVRTLHNLRPHEGGGTVERVMLLAIDRMVVQFVALNEETPAPDARPVRLIRHGNYHQPFARHPRNRPTHGRLLYFGLIRPYKGVEDLIRCFGALDDDELTLRLVGKPQGGLGDTVTSAVEDDVRVSCHLAFVPDSTLVEEVSIAELVVLPYRELHNSGALLVALSLDRPVLVPDTPTTARLAREVGEPWVQRFSGPLTTEAISDALATVRRSSLVVPPRLSDRDWQSVSGRHYALYRELLAERRRQRVPARSSHTHPEKAA